MEDNTYEMPFETEDSFRIQAESGQIRVKGGWNQFDETIPLGLLEQIWMEM